MLLVDLPQGRRAWGRRKRH